MRKYFTLLAVLLLGGISAFAQQDPNDPGLQDSLIIGSVQRADDSLDVFQYRFVQIWAITDDSVAFYNFPLKWQAPGGGVYFGAGTQYFHPLTSWAVAYDTVMLGENYVRQVGWLDLNTDSIPHYALKTNGLRFNIWALRFVVPPYTPEQLVTLDTCYDDRNGSLLLGLIDGVYEFKPGFQSGFIEIGFPLGVDDERSLPQAMTLSQNYPNPFNPSTTIEFTIPSTDHISLDIYNILGERVKILANRIFEPGVYSAIWDGTAQDGKQVPSGIYFYRLTALGVEETKKMVLLK